MSKVRLTEEQKEFYQELSEKCNDTITSIELVSFQGSETYFNYLGIILPPGRKDLWAILAFGEKGLHIYVSPSETTILGFKVGNQKKAPKEQLFSFDSFLSWSIEQPIKRVFFWEKLEKYSLVLNFEISSPTQGNVKGSFVLQTQMLAKETRAKINSYKT